LSFYAFSLLAGTEDIAVFRGNVALIAFGDDKIESVSDEYANIYNYFSVKKIMTDIGHTITPGAKDGIERAYCNFDDLIFLKRHFRTIDQMVVAPLLTRSIEGPLVWTQIPTCDLEIWKNLIDAQLYEAYLHGEEYYSDFCKKLSKGRDQRLNDEIASLISVPYSQFGIKYKTRYYGHPAQKEFDT